MDKRPESLGPWVAELGYDRVDGALVRGGAQTVDLHPFAPELRAILTPNYGLPAQAVFCVDRVPTVCLLDQQQLSSDPQVRRNELRQFCERLWNQNLARVVLITDTNSLEAWSVDNPNATPLLYSSQEREEATRAWSVSGLLGGEALNGRDDWFDPHKRVDKVLLDNIIVLVENLVRCDLDASAARRLVARLIFITYLEDRGIVGETYRSQHHVRPLFDVIRERDSTGLRKLIKRLRTDFNGDFLTSADSEIGWENLSHDAFDWISKFLSQTTLRTGQASFWRYDFSQIPIELIAGIYETFLATKEAGENQLPSEKEKRKRGAYYTPRLLADWVVDLAIQDRDVLSEYIFDGACGSGMLLTAAFRRLIRAFETQSARNGLPAEADFITRRNLLTEHIFGGDIDEDACQLTAFSLYLALLTDLNPRDLAELRRGGHKLPSLTHNIRRGAEGDFFSNASEIANCKQYSIFLSNPPWRELTANEPAAEAMRSWQLRQKKPRPHVPKRQIAAAFALGAADTLKPGGRVALILPVNPFVSADPTQRDFRAHLLGRYRIEKIINFADMRRLIFADAIHPFVVLIAQARPPEERFTSVEAESFEYWTPKTDISLAFGRLAVHGGDREDLSASMLISDEAQLAIRYWGSKTDIALLQKLKRYGCIGDLVQDGWLDAKGFHARDEDRRRPEETWYTEVPDWMATNRFLPTTGLTRDLPFVPKSALRDFPFDKIARITPKRLFEGPRVLWTDGAHPEDGVKAAYAEMLFTYQHSVAVLSAPNNLDGRLTARFLTAYIRSPMGLWLLLLLSSSVASERPKLHVCEAMDWPFWSLERHPEPAHARCVMEETDRLLAVVEESNEIFQTHEWEQLQPQLNALVYSYFKLTVDEVALIEELATLVGPALQPTSLRHRALMRPLRQAPTAELMHNYCVALTQTLEKWRDATGGEGEIHAATWTGHSVPLAAAVLTLGGNAPNDRYGDDCLIEELSAALRRAADLPAETLLTIPDLAIVDGNRIFLIKPMIARFWMRRCAIEDANRLAMQFQSLSKSRT
ncbi:Eco57I restriction-modification methylase domain-containing protein [Ferribacterium limneticum]|uniref:Eco57I restriction-modification methylase domain-containing protein n=1 Tax=Ferribacterium limneticum TaxID=76259 RepID=UPI001CF93868|nr:N-6 DNA methylase [Ferribacterium limneticum]UCV28136.1 N-6 DNA methylase [Ferribacterium limneticum]UCV32053.1 N-6 DNA methylase [Ferribacterium limneticum]